MAGSWSIASVITAFFAKGLASISVIQSGWNVKGNVINGKSWIQNNPPYFECLMLNLDMSSSQTDATEFANAIIAKRRSMIVDDFWKGRTKGFFGSITWCKQLVVILVVFSCIFVFFKFWAVNEKSNKKEEVQTRITNIFHVFLPWTLPQHNKRGFTINNLEVECKRPTQT